MADLRRRQFSKWPWLFTVIAVQVLAGCGNHQPQTGVNTQSQTQGPANEVSTLQAQIQQTESSSMPPQMKRQVEANLNAQIQAKKQSSPP